jgi:hypothetical protein
MLVGPLDSPVNPCALPGEFSIARTDDQPGGFVVRSHLRARVDGGVVTTWLQQGTNPIGAGRVEHRLLDRTNLAPVLAQLRGPRAWLAASR